MHAQFSLAEVPTTTSTDRCLFCGACLYVTESLAEWTPAMQPWIYE